MASRASSFPNYISKRGRARGSSPRPVFCRIKEWKDRECFLACGCSPLYAAVWSHKGTDGSVDTVGRRTNTGVLYTRRIESSFSILSRIKLLYGGSKVFKMRDQHCRLMILSTSQHTLPGISCRCRTPPSFLWHVHPRRIVPPAESFRTSSRQTAFYIPGGMP